MYNVGNESSEEDGEEDELGAKGDEEMKDINFKQFVENRRNMQISKGKMDQS